MKVLQSAIGGPLLTITLFHGASASQPPRFQKLSPHCHMLAGAAGSPNVGAIVTGSGVLIVNPPAGERLASTLEALKSVTSRPVRWCVCTDSRYSLAGGAAALSRQGTLVVTSQELLEVGRSAPVGGDEDSPPLVPQLQLAFKREMCLFPENLEIRIASLDSTWQEGGSVTVFIPAEKVLMAGDVFVPGSYPPLEGEPGKTGALKWIAAMKEVLESIPLLKSAMPQPKPDPAVPAEEPKTLEEQVIVMPSSGPASTLQALKDMLDEAQKLRSEVARAVARGRSRDTFLAGPAFGPFRGVGSFESFAIRLYDDLTAK